jgi:hypothetical protein
MDVSRPRALLRIARDSLRIIALQNNTMNVNLAPVRGDAQCQEFPVTVTVDDLRSDFAGCRHTVLSTTKV